MEYKRYVKNCSTQKLKIYRISEMMALSTEIMSRRITITILIIFLCYRNCIVAVCGSSSVGGVSTSYGVANRFLAGDDTSSTSTSMPSSTPSPSTSSIPSASSIPSNVPSLRPASLPKISTKPSGQPTNMPSMDSGISPPNCTVDYYLYEEGDIYISINNNIQISYPSCHINIEARVTCSDVQFEGWVNMKLYYFSDVTPPLAIEEGTLKKEQVEKISPFFLYGNKKEKVFLSPSMEAGDYSIQSTLLSSPLFKDVKLIETPPVHFTFYPCVNW